MLLHLELHAYCVDITSGATFVAFILVFLNCNEYMSIQLLQASPFVQILRVDISGKLYIILFSDNFLQNPIMGSLRVGLSLF